jgi:hypothetical protein
VQRIYSDSLGSAVAMTEAPDATPIVSSQRYYPYGATRGPDAVDTPYPYTSRRHEPDLGLYYYRARWYGWDTMSDALVRLRMFYNDDEESAFVRDIGFLYAGMPARSQSTGLRPYWSVGGFKGNIHIYIQAGC